MWILFCAEALARAGGGDRHPHGGGLWLLPFLPLLLVWIHLHRKRRQEADAALQITLRALAQREAHWEPAALRQTAAALFARAQEAWCQQDLRWIRQNLEPALAADWEEKIAAMRRRGERNALHGLVLLQAHLVDHVDQPGPDGDEVSLDLLATAQDRTFGPDGRLLREGPSSFSERWVFRHRSGRWRLAAIRSAAGPIPPRSVP